jgi:hypothetical protein
VGAAFAMTKPVLVILVTGLCLCSCSRPGEGSAPNGVVVQALGGSLPQDDDRRQAFLWKLCEAAEEKFDSYTDKEWEDNFAAFAKCLVRKAAAQRLDSASLRAVLDLVFQESNGMAYLPVAAYQTSLQGKPVWILVLKWEQESLGYGLGHVQARAFDQKTLKLVDFASCK